MTAVLVELAIVLAVVLAVSVRMVTARSDARGVEAYAPRHRRA